MTQIFHKELAPLVGQLRKYRGHSNCPVFSELCLKVTQLFRDNTNVDLNFSRPNPLSPMEMISLALRVTGNNQKETADLLKTKVSCIRTYEGRTRDKLEAGSMLEALYIASKKNYLIIIREEECPYL